VWRLVSGGCVLVVLLHTPALAAPSRATAVFAERSYAAGTVGRLELDAPAGELSVQMFQAGAEPAAVRSARQMAGAPVDDPRTVDWRGGSGSIDVALWSWPSGVYFAKVRGRWGATYAPLIVRPARLGAHRIAVVEPTNTWQAYNDFDGGSWYFGGGDTVDLSRPYLANGVPPHFNDYDAGFLRWLYRTGRQVDVLSDDDLASSATGTRSLAQAAGAISGGRKRH
jgi:hypothetical protein